jgi:hypothetical protein
MGNTLLYVPSAFFLPSVVSAAFYLQSILADFSIDYHSFKIATAYDFAGVE